MKHIDNMSKMRRSHRKVRDWLKWKRGYPFVYFIQHTRWQKDIDIDGVKFDGFAIKRGKVVFFQVKSNAFPKVIPYVMFAKRYRFPVLLINVRDKKGISWRAVTEYGRYIDEEDKEIWKF